MCIASPADKKWYQGEIVKLDAKTWTIQFDGKTISGIFAVQSCRPREGSTWT
jgi:hypothetical protein